MTTKHDGGPAFPAQPIYHYPDGSAIVHEQGGMTLRDYFAAKAIQGILSVRLPEGELHSAAQYAYSVADAMLAERSRP